MNKRIFTALAAISFILFIMASPGSAQESQTSNATPVDASAQANKQNMSLSEAEKLRSEVVAAYAESEALLKFLGGYNSLRQSNAMKDYELACQELANGRMRIEHMSTEEIMSQSSQWPYAKTLSRTVKLSQSLRTNANFLRVLQKMEGFSQADLQSLNSSAAMGLNSRGVIAAPAYIPPACNHDDPSNYPSGVDLGIAKGVAIALHIAVEAQPSEFMIFCVMIPNPFRIAFAIAAGITDQVLNALTAVAADATYCESIRLYVEETLTSNGGFNALSMDDDYYLTFTLKSVRASLTRAVNQGVPTNCAQQRLMEAAAFFDGSDNFTGTGPQRVDAIKKLRAAYHNIGASSCVQ
ncbi:MAG: hypothetical protein JST85_24120 [Acidobacteria bacterium]|nr:hypothetical protein [Acidobacteriota bacterium]